MKYPKVIYVQKEQDRDDSFYLNADEKIEDREDGQVAIYELKKIVKKSTKTIIS